MRTIPTAVEATALFADQFASAEIRRSVWLAAAQVRRAAAAEADATAALHHLRLATVYEERAREAAGLMPSCGMFLGESSFHARIEASLHRIENQLSDDANKFDVR
jgi:hypothetical protein